MTINLFDIRMTSLIKVAGCRPHFCRRHYHSEPLSLGSKAIDENKLNKFIKTSLHMHEARTSSHRVIFFQFRSCRPQ